MSSPARVGRKSNLTRHHGPCAGDPGVEEHGASSDPDGRDRPGHDGRASDPTWAGNNARNRQQTCDRSEQRPSFRAP
ncbi:hypothetical protein FS320_21605 [Microvirga tunisiensis]|uniref:Uncharacterized protein n=1 Tax=Microvirga tunisiensis TaxID=2108360 RepID=A0A5N7MUH2_9HYPH|nr:hypothetical protein [Microvirga tunisiensis]MPR27696.1 hypothetical protein [Microvirga tunisiensis]